MIMLKYNEEKSALAKNKEKVGDGSKIKVLFQSDSGEHYSIVYDVLTELTEDKIKEELRNRSKKSYDSADYIIQLYSILLNLNGVKVSKRGGCDTKVEKEIYHQFNRYHAIKYVSVVSENNNCGIECFIQFIEKNDEALKNVYKADNVRKQLNLKVGKRLDLDEMKLVANYFNVGMSICDGDNNFVMLCGYKLESKLVCNIILTEKHYCYITATIKKHHCNGCRKLLRDDNTAHVCSVKQINAVNTIVDKVNTFVPIKNIAEKEQIDSKNDIIFFDLETFPTKNDVHVPYACGWLVGGEYSMRYGENCMDDFIELLMSSKHKVIMAYNGSAFDYYFLINLLSEKKAKIDSDHFIISNGKILGFRFGEDNKVFDLCRFVMSSLDDACGSFDIENAKSTFDHNRVKSFEDANREDVKADVIPYLKLDVLALEELYNKFADMIWEMFQINISSYFTLTHMAYAIWSNMLKYNIEIYKSQEKYDFTKNGTFGARCMPNQKLFKSEHYDKVKEQKMTYEELLQTKDFMFNADATSLYPCAMAGFEHLDVKYPVGLSRWSEEPEKEFNSGKLGYYEIEFQCNKKLRVPILPRKVNGGLSWSLHGMHWLCRPAE
jgi:hypothetical protein